MIEKKLIKRWIQKHKSTFSSRINSICSLWNKSYQYSYVISFNRVSSFLNTLDFSKPCLSCVGLIKFASSTPKRTRHLWEFKQGTSKDKRRLMSSGKSQQLVCAEAKLQKGNRIMINKLEERKYLSSYQQLLYPYCLMCMPLGKMAERIKNIYD